MEKGLNVEIIYFETLPSTQTYLIEALKKGDQVPPVCIVAEKQINGVGSRGNHWECVDEALTFSFVLFKNQLPHDLPIHSSSIYFGFIFKEMLAMKGSKVWLKWPNDLYIGQKKVGGVMVNIVNHWVICGIGVNCHTKQERYGSLEKGIARKQIIEEYVQIDFLTITWKQIFSKYQLEFQLNKGYSFHDGEKLIPMEQLTLLEDGSLFDKGKIFFSER